MSQQAASKFREPTIALVFSPESWVEQLHRYLADHGGARVRQIVLEPSVALEEEYDTLVVSHRWPALSKPLIDSIHNRGRRVLGVYPAEEPGGCDYLRAIGVDAAIGSGSSPTDFVDVLVGLGSLPGAPMRAQSELALVGVSPAPRPTSASSAIAVGGSSGTGSTEVAIELARAIAGRGHEVALVDADGSRASVAVRLALPIEPNLRTAVDAVENGLGNLDATLVRVGAGRLRVLCGLPNAAAAEHVRGSEVVDVIRVLEHSHAQVVGDCGSILSEGIGRAVVAEAGALVGVGAGTPVGVSRLLAWIADARLIAPRVALHLVVNHAPADRFRRREIAMEIARTFEPASLVFGPFDRRVAAATWDGSFLARGGFTAALAPLAELVAPQATERRVSERRRGRRRALAMAPNARAATNG
jgi:MinD-like ATPase involved in chromosome partitioning or flagellar assembly